MGLFDRLKSRLTKTRAALSDGITSLFKGGRAIDAQLLGELEELLYTADLGALAVDLVADVERAHKRGDVKGEEDVRARLKQSLLERLQPEALPLELPHQPTVVLVAGVNGSGKTTSIAKLAHHFTSQGKKVLLGAGDTFRAAAADQLEVWAGRTGAAIVRGPEGGDPASVAFDAVDKGVKGASTWC